MLSFAKIKPSRRFPNLQFLYHIRSNNINVCLSLSLCIPSFVLPDLLTSPGAEPGFLERGFICINLWGFALLILSHFSKISHANETNYFILIGYLKIWGGGEGQRGGLSKPPEPPLDPPLFSLYHPFYEPLKLW